MFAMYDMGNVANIWIAQALIDPVTLGEALDKWRIGYIVMGCVSGFGALALLLPLWYVQLSSSIAKSPCLLTAPSAGSPPSLTSLVPSSSSWPCR